MAVWERFIDKLRSQDEEVVGCGVISLAAVLYNDSAIQAARVAGLTQLLAPLVHKDKPVAVLKPLLRCIAALVSSASIDDVLPLDPEEKRLRDLAQCCIPIGDERPLSAEDERADLRAAQECLKDEWTKDNLKLVFLWCPDDIKVLAACVLNTLGFAWLFPEGAAETAGHMLVRLLAATTHPSTVEVLLRPFSILSLSSHILLSCGIVSRLTDFLTADEGVSAEAANVISIAVFNPEVMQMLLADGCIPLLVGMATTGTPHQKIQAVSALGRLVSRGAAAEVLAAGGVPPAVAALNLERGSTRPFMHSLRAMIAIADDRGCMCEALAAGCVPQLVAYIEEVLAHKDNDGDLMRGINRHMRLSRALRVLTAICTNARGNTRLLQAVIDGGGLSAAIHVVKEGQVRAFVYSCNSPAALSMLRHISAVAELRPAVIAAGAVPTLLSCLKPLGNVRHAEPATPEGVNNSVAVLVSLAESQEGRQAILAQADGVSTLLDAFRGGWHDLHDKALHFIQLMAADDAAYPAVFVAGGSQVLLAGAKAALQRRAIKGRELVDVCLKVVSKSTQWVKDNKIAVKVLDELPSLALSPDRRHCKLCGTREESHGDKLAVCRGCRSVYYCSEDCKQADWFFHRFFCTAEQPWPLLYL